MWGMKGTVGTLKVSIFQPYRLEKAAQETDTCCDPGEEQKLSGKEAEKTNALAAERSEGLEREEDGVARLRTGS